MAPKKLLSVRQRQAHSKSRRGCVACKQRRIKCDERGPPCANCVVRKTECAYPYVRSGGAGDDSLKADSSGSTSHSPPPDQQALSRSSSSSTSPFHSGLPSLSLYASSVPSPASFSACRSDNRLMELELIHRWSTRTWTAMLFIPGNESFLQYELPRLALRHGYVMDGLMAMAAVDLAITAASNDTPDFSRYLCTAIEHSNRASASFRAQLSHINRDNLYILYFFATMAAFLNFVAPAPPITPLQHADMAFSMILGASHIAAVNFEWLLDSPLSNSMTGYVPRLELLDSLDPDTRAATGRMSSIICVARVPPRGDASAAHESGQEYPLAVDVVAYQLTVGQIIYAFAEGHDGLLRGNWLIAMSIGRDDFAGAVRAREHVALFILMYWAVLVHRAGIASPEKGWWIGEVGRDLVREVSEHLVSSPLALFDEVKEGIAWTRQQVGLQPLPGCTWPSFDDLLESFLNLDQADVA